MLVQLIRQGDLLDTTRIARVTVVVLRFGLAAGHPDFLRVHDHDVVAGINVRRVLGLVLAAKTKRDLTGQSTENLVRGINHVPVTLYGFGLGAKRFHENVGWDMQKMRRG